jgi:tripartite-type tricarboxylate transporter receptor subunit TctC
MKKLFFSFWLALLGAATAHAESPYFQGQTITLIVGYQSGDGFDIWARLLAAHMGKHIPGHPNIIAQNMPGAGSMIAANHIYNVAKPDGLTIGAVGPSLYLDQLVGKKEAHFDWARYGWIGSTEDSPWLLYVRADAPYKNLDDIRRAAQPPKCSATATGSSGYFIPKLLEETFGAKFNIVMGYRGGAEQDLAFERGEVVCRSLSVATFFAREPFMTWRKQHLIRILVQTGRKRDARMPNVPTIHELMNDYKTAPDARAFVTVILASGDLGRPFVTPPGIAPDRLKTLRDGFRKTMRSPAFLADARNRKLEPDPQFGEDLELIAKQSVNQPKEIVERMKKMLGE